MAKSKLTETKKITHKLASEGELTIENNIAVVNIPDEGVKNLIELLKNFSGKYVKFSFTEEEIEDVVSDEFEEDDE
ncbi:MAG: hypothetical protein A2Y34_05525 [Spirochaetes bacterium GWC1_27_15]|nr:MAG: hypothetical protein A2Y34_05525 [Spirochaetes bacterium GWC1_27_15]